VALAEMCSGEIGAQVRFASTLPMHAYAFGEDQARYLLVTEAQKKDEVVLQLNQVGIPFTDLGKTIPDLLIVEDVMRVPVTHLRAINEAWLPEFMAA
jgi:phosphoribosylformylglycinamidine (FGAM) synthase-like enzyme